MCCCSDDTTATQPTSLDWLFARNKGVSFFDLFIVGLGPLYAFVKLRLSEFLIPKQLLMHCFAMRYFLLRECFILQMIGFLWAGFSFTTPQLLTKTAAGPDKRPLTSPLVKSFYEDFLNAKWICSSLFVVITFPEIGELYSNLRIAGSSAWAK